MFQSMSALCTSSNALPRLSRCFAASCTLSFRSGTYQNQKHCHLTSATAFPAALSNMPAPAASQPHLVCTGLASVACFGPSFVPSAQTATPRPGRHTVPILWRPTAGCVRTNRCEAIAEVCLRCTACMLCGVLEGKLVCGKKNEWPQLCTNDRRTRSAHHLEEKIGVLQSDSQPTCVTHLLCSCCAPTTWTWACSTHETPSYRHWFKHPHPHRP